MYKYSKLFIFSFLSLLVFNANSGDELICETFGPTQTDQILGYIDSSLAIASAEAISKSVISNNKSLSKFRITKVWKDHIGLPPSEIEVRTEYPEAINYSVGEEYFLYLTYGDVSATFITSVCLGTKNIKDAPEIELELLKKSSEK